MTFDGIDRRALLQRALLLVGAAALPGGTQALAAAVKSAKRQLDAPHYALLTAVADTILPKTATPGAVEVGVPQYIDALLGTWATPQSKAKIVGTLDAIDRLAREQHQRGFAQLTPAEREAVLTPYDVAALKPAPAPPTKADPKVGRAKQEPVQARSMSSLRSPAYADAGYGKLKELVVTVFYYSETALTHDLAYEHAPGAWEPSTPLTPTTRPWGGAGLI